MEHPLMGKIHENPLKFNFTLKFSGIGWNRLKSHGKIPSWGTVISPIV
jgi:hypothetical protein